jgi:hypothetical protein
MCSRRLDEQHDGEQLAQVWGSCLQRGQDELVESRRLEVAWPVILLLRPRAFLDGGLGVETSSSWTGDEQVEPANNTSETLSGSEVGFPDPSPVGPISGAFRVGVSGMPDLNSAQEHDTK